VEFVQFVAKNLGVVLAESTPDRKCPVVNLACRMKQECNNPVTRKVAGAFLKQWNVDLT
jgi:exosome complex RNA-binding protein Csl4